ncbi:MAG: slipin family protein [Candidatus Altiarchaeota archaeon]|nr:slipin family protein [Candidatus Altiarchaeota archaeon]
MGLSLFKIINQYERGVLFAFGEYEGMREPGFNFLIPIYHDLVIVDTRIKTVDIPKQEVMTRDNVPVMINAVVYFRIEQPEKAVIEVRDVIYAVSKYAQTSLRNVTGQATLDELLSARQKIAEKLREIVDVVTQQWGVDVTAIELQDIELPEDLKRTMAKQAEAEREKRAVILNSEGEVGAAENIAKAAKKLYAAPGALHLRTLHTINDISSDKSQTVIYALPIEVLRAVERLVDLLEIKTGQRQTKK